MAKYLKDMREGDDYAIKIMFGTGVSIAGFKFWLTLKRSFSDADSAAVLQVETSAGDDPGDDVANGLAYIRVAGSSLIGLKGKYFYDVQVKDAGGKSRALVPPVEDYKDKISIAPQVTQDDI